MLRIGPEESLTGQIFLSELGVQQKRYTNCIALAKFDALCPTLCWIKASQSTLFGSVSTGPGPFTMFNTSSGSSCVNPNPVGLPIHRDPLSGLKELNPPRKERSLSAKDSMSHRRFV